ncbi:unnamed protein product [Meloidogyne enterolobii]|uniref:Uncharacterized protein n=1 Tax=Meloidogyne enterolobii TaxID=390850 RepID=A0ACB1A8H2_MELEN
MGSRILCSKILGHETFGILTITGNIQQIMKESITRARVYASKFMKLNKFGDISKTKLIVNLLPVTNL